MARADGPRPAHTYRRARRNGLMPGGLRRLRACDQLKAARLARGISRRALDAERFAIREFLEHDRVCPGFTAGGLLEILTHAVAHAPRP